MSRQSGVLLEGYPNYIAPMNLEKLSSRNHPLGGFPQYPITTEPASWFEESVSADRYKQLVDDWCRINNIEDRNKVPQPGMEMMFTLGRLFNDMVMSEYGKYPQLISIAEESIREYFNLDETEVLFDLEILDPTRGEKVADHFKAKNGEKPESFCDNPSFTPDFRDELIRRRLTNAITQGASLKGHYIFHLSADKLNSLIPGITNIYNKAMVTNDLHYWYIDDVVCGQMTEAEEQIGMMEVDYSGDVPVIRCKSACFTVLLHEMIKGVMEIFSAHGLPKDPVVATKVVDFCDTVMNEFWDIRIGPKFWEMLYKQIGGANHQYLKHILVAMNQLSTPDYLEFIQELFSESETVKLFINDVVRKKKKELAAFHEEMTNYLDSPEA